MFTRRNVIAASAAALALSACGRGGNAGRILKIGSQRGGTKAVMLAAGALKGAPYAVEWSEFPAAQTLLEAIGSGAVDVGVTGDAPFQFAYQSGSPIKAVGAQQAQPQPRAALAIIVPAGSPLHSAADLRGKRIATTRGSVGHYLVLRILAEAGWRTEDVKITYLSPSDSRAALQTGAIDAWSTWVPYIPAAVAEGARILVDGQGYSSGYGFDVANETAIAGKAAILADFLEREARAIDWANGHVDEYAKVLAAETGLPLDIARATVVANNRQRAAITPQVVADQQQVLDTFVGSGEIKGNRPIADGFVLTV